MTYNSKDYAVLFCAHTYTHKAKIYNIFSFLIDILLHT